MKNKRRLEEQKKIREEAEFNKPSEEWTIEEWRTAFPREKVLANGPVITRISDCASGMSAFDITEELLRNCNRNFSEDVIKRRMDNVYQVRAEAREKHTDEEIELYFTYGPKTTPCDCS